MKGSFDGVSENGLAHGSSSGFGADQVGLGAVSVWRRSLAKDSSSSIAVALRYEGNSWPSTSTGSSVDEMRSGSEPWESEFGQVCRRPGRHLIAPTWDDDELIGRHDQWIPMPGEKRSLSELFASRRVKKRKVINRSVWNSKDDWDKLVADSSLSTASISSRRPIHSGHHPLSYYAAEVAARAFKFLWEEDGEWWKAEWAYVSEPIKAKVRERVYRYYGEFLSVQILAEVSLTPQQQLMTGLHASSNHTSSGTSITSRCSS